jgi:predicted benzoate:H+ symporter BenE
MAAMLNLMKQPRFSLASLLLLAAAMPIWLFLCLRVPASTGFGGGGTRFVMAPMVLCGITAAIQRLLRALPHAWALSALLAGVIALASLALAAWIDSNS